MIHEYIENSNFHTIESILKRESSKKGIHSPRRISILLSLF